MASYKYSLPSGIPGMVTRSGATIEPQLLDSSNQPSEYGSLVVIDATSHKLRAFGASDTVALGLLVRPYPFQQPSTDHNVPQSGIVDVMRRGYMSVHLNAGTAVNEGKVYARIANASAGKPIGGIEAAAVADETVEITNAKFTGAADADGNVEIEFNL
jgi:hypothetical protein